MGTSRSVAQFQRKLFKATAGLETATYDAMRRASTAATQTLNQTIAGMTGGDMIARNAADRR